MCSNLPAPLWCHTLPGPSCPETLWPWKGEKKGLGCSHAASVLPSTGQMREDRKGLTLPVNGTKWSGTSSFTRCQQINRRIPQHAPTISQTLKQEKSNTRGVQSSISIPLFFLNNSIQIIHHQQENGSCWLRTMWMGPSLPSPRTLWSSLFAWSINFRPSVRGISLMPQTTINTPIKSVTSTVLGELLCVFLRSGVNKDQNHYNYNNNNNNY